MDPSTTVFPSRYQIPQWVLDSGLLDVVSVALQHPGWMLALVLVGAVIVIVGRESVLVSVGGYLVGAGGVLGLVWSVLVDPGMEQVALAFVGAWLIVCVWFRPWMTKCRS